MTLLVALALQAPLIFNTGYLSFDELQWWARADVPAWHDLPWVAWTDLRAFQFRPLTFNLWLLLAHALAAHPFAMHAVFVLLGSVNACLLAFNLTAMGARRSTAASAALIFVCSPYVAYTHGWTGTLADLLVLLCGLGAFAALRALPAAPSPARVAAVTVCIAVSISLALFAKESAVVLPLLLAFAAVAHPAPRRVLALCGLAAAIVALYLFLRLPILLGVDASQSGYAWHLRNIPARVAEYALFPWMPPLFEVAPALGKGALRIAVATACVAGLLAALARASRPLAAATMLLFAGLLAPVLILDQAFNQYAYLASAALVGSAAFAWRDCTRGSRTVLLALAAIASLHGAQVMLRMREIGAIELRFHVDLSACLASDPGSVSVVPSRASDAWLLRRFVDHVPGYRGVDFRTRVAIDAAEYSTTRLTMQPDGSLLGAQPRDRELLR
ncbi:MAG: hypothetical protein ABI846_11305 [Rudaea sp.]